MIMVMMVIEGMDGVSTNHGCEWKWTWIHTNKQDERCLMNDEDSRMQIPAINTLPVRGSSLRR